MLTVHVETFGWEEQNVHGLYMGSHVSLHVKTRVICVSAATKIRYVIAT